ncbi:MAG TPA: hypothetical protein VKB78_08295, partial [Pirellulales bacterium]|nr:hypothetical protein [Pirellulales bacterium]
MPDEPTNPLRENASTVIRDIPCPFCSCLCDDLVATVQGDMIVTITGACDAARPWFIGERPSAPLECRVDGRPADVREAIDRTAELLATARHPLIYGLSRATCKAQAVAVEIAELLEGVLDVPMSRGAIEALQSVGEVSCTYGEIRNRADLIVVWNADLATTHPRFIERFVRRDGSASTSRGRQSADSPPHVIAIDTADRSRSSDSVADERIVIREGRGFDTATTLRALTKGVPLDATDIEQRTGVALDAWRKLADSMKHSRYGVLLTSASSDNSAEIRTREALAALARELNEYARFVIVDLPSGSNVVGAANVIAWRTGYPPSIDFWRGDPTSNSAESTVDRLLMSREIDAVL